MEAARYAKTPVWLVKLRGNRDFRSKWTEGFALMSYTDQIVSGGDTEWMLMDPRLNRITYLH